MDYRAIEENEAALDRLIAEALAEGNKDGAASAGLQRAIIRPWLMWVNANRKDPKLLMNAFTHVWGGYIAEVAYNYHKGAIEIGVDSSHEEILKRVLTAVVDTAVEETSRMVEGTALSGTPMDLQKQADA